MRLTLLLCTLLLACNQPSPISSINPENWQKRKASTPLPDSLEAGTSYLSIYSEIYSRSESQTHELTVTVSMRNTSPTDTVFVERAEYYNTAGEAIRTYFTQPIYLAPLETVEIIIDKLDKTGGSGANFLFDWKIQPGSSEPFFEAVMISTFRSQGLSFTTQGIRIR